MKWNNARVEELDALRVLLHEVAGLDNGSGFLSKVKHSIQIAKMLSDSKLSVGHMSFLVFLDDLAVKDRSGKV